MLLLKKIKVFFFPVKEVKPPKKNGFKPYYGNIAPWLNEK